MKNIDSCDEVCVKLDVQHPTDRHPCIYLLRQLFVCSGTWLLYFVLGLCFGAPTVFIPQIRKEANSTDAISVEMESWLTSIHGYSALPFVIIMPIITQYVGRKLPFLFVCLNTVVCFIIFYWSNNPMHLLLSEMLQGILLASNMTLLIVIITEYSSTNYRGLFMSIESTTFFCGVWVANAAGTFSHWKNIALLAFGCCALCFSAFFWPESPHWLAMKGNFNECIETHHWLKGYSKESEKELQSLIKSQKAYLEEIKSRNGMSLKHKLILVIKTIKARAFYEPILLGFAIISLYHFSGKMVCTMYAVELIHKITKDEFTSYIGMLILEGVTIIGMQIGCILSKYVKRRSLLFFSSAIGIIFLLIISLYLYLINLGIFVENKILSIALLMAFSFTISMGPMVLSGSLFCEMISLRYKSSSLLIITLYSELLMATVLKMSPHIFQLLTLHGAFFFYGISATTFALILYKYMPETKDKTLNEIELYFLRSSKL